MSDQHIFVSPDHFHPDAYTRSQTAGHMSGLRSAGASKNILRALTTSMPMILRSASETLKETIRGTARVRSLLLNFLVPLHVMAEVGGVSMSIRETTIPGDAAGETHSAIRNQ